PSRHRRHQQDMKRSRLAFEIDGGGGDDGADESHRDNAEHREAEEEHPAELLLLLRSRGDATVVFHPRDGVSPEQKQQQPAEVRDAQEVIALAPRSGAELFAENGSERRETPEQHALNITLRAAVVTREGEAPA